MKKYSLYFMAALYATAGVLHFIVPGFYLKIMPDWMPWKILLISLSGIAELLLAVLLIYPATRKIAAWLIIAMLVVFFFVIHIPQSISYYHNHHPLLLVTLVRLPIQFLLIAWAYIYTKQKKANNYPHH